MGKPQSKAQSTGDPQIAIINVLEQHSIYHEQQTLLLWVLLGIVAVLILLAVCRKWIRWHRAEALRAARSVMNMNA